MDGRVEKNYAKINAFFFYLPLSLLLLIFAGLYQQDALSIASCIQLQKSTFLYMNSVLGQYPTLLFNFTQLGDCVVLLPFLSIFLIYAPKIWEALISALIISIILTIGLKKMFRIPRPAAVFEHDSFIIIGKTLRGYNSLPSGHSITAFTLLTVLLFAFMPMKWKYKIFWTAGILALGFMIVVSRIGVGAHYPLDVLVGSIVGYTSGVGGIYVNQKYQIWAGIRTRKFQPVIIAIFVIIAGVLISKIIKENLIVYYVSLLSLIVSLYLITHKYVKK